MSIKIHHGPAGSYKTSGAISDDVINIIKQGRTLVTNVRGFSRELAVEVLGKAVHKDFKVIFVDTDKAENRARLARFFHWCPKGAYIFIDEAQRIWNPKATTKEIKELAIPADKLQDDKPEDLEAAFDMHRHQNWDFVFTTTNIKKIHPIIRQNAEFGYRHVNLALIGIAGLYKEVTHDSSNDGQSISNQVSVQFKKIPKKVFKLYKSTQTGSVSDTIAGKPLWKDPKVFALVFGLLCFWTYLLGFRSTPRAMGGDEAAATQAAAEAPKVSSNGGSPTPANNAPIDSGSVLFGDDTGIIDNPYLSRFDDVVVTGSLITTGRNGVFYIFSAFDSKHNEYTFNSDDLTEVGYYIKRLTNCSVDVTYNGVTQRLYCAFDVVDNSPLKQDVNDSFDVERAVTN